MTNKLLGMLNKKLEQATERYGGVKKELSEGRSLVKRLPDFMTEINWYIFHKRTGDWYLETQFLDDVEGDNLVKQFRGGGLIRDKCKWGIFY